MGVGFPTQSSIKLKATQIMCTYNTQARIYLLTNYTTLEFRKMRKKDLNYYGNKPK